MLFRVFPFIYLFAINYNINSISCGELSTLRSLRELLSGFISTNTTQILQARKQTECDNNKY